MRSMNEGRSQEVGRCSEQLTRNEACQDSTLPQIAAGAALCLPGGQASMGAVGGRGERAGPAGGVALRRPANGVARRTLESFGERRRSEIRSDSTQPRKTRFKEGAPCWSLGGPTTLLLLLLEFFRWLCSSLVAPSWKVLGRAPRSMVNSGVLSSNRAIRTT